MVKNAVILLGVFLNMFEKLKAISDEIEKKFSQNAMDKMKIFTALSSWGQVYHLGDHEDFHKAPKVNESFSRILPKKVNSLRSVSLSLAESSKLEACIRGQIESQSFSLWDLASIFEFLKRV